MASRTKKLSDDIADRIKFLRKQHNLTQKELSEKLYKSESTVRMWELGKSEPDLDTLNKLSAIFNVSTDYLVGKASSGNKGIRIPVYGNVAAGIPLDAVTDIEDWEEITEEMAVSGDYIALRIHGDSMEPRMTNGDVVIVRLQPDVDSGDMAIVLVNGDQATCKRVQKTVEGIMLVSTNTAYAPMFYSNKQIEDLPVRILGKVVELRAKF